MKIYDRIVEFPIYHNTLSYGTFLSILKDDCLRANGHGFISFTRSKSYLSDKRIQLVFDYYELRNRFRIVPYSYKGYLDVNYPHHMFRPSTDEMEERIYTSSVSFSKYVSEINF